jgi:hypothetical protein
MVRHLEVRERDHRFNAVLQAFIKQVVIELEPCFVRLPLIAQREDTCPGNRSAEAFDPISAYS